MAPRSKASRLSRKIPANGKALSCSKFFSNRLLKDRTSDLPLVACYCATFLKPEMLHIYRQITSLKRVEPFVIAQKREQADRYPFERIAIVGKPATHFTRRFWFKQVRDAPWQVSPGEVRKLMEILSKVNARLLHIYFGHIAVHLLPLIQAWPKPALVSFHGADV